MSRYVQHVSGQGEQWRVVSESDHATLWHVYWLSPHDNGAVLTTLPKSEYRLIEPPERWVDVTAECEFDPMFNRLDLSPGRAMAGQYVPLMKGYRLRMVRTQDPYYPVFFIVERKEST